MKHPNTATLYELSVSHQAHFDGTTTRQLIAGASEMASLMSHPIKAHELPYPVETLVTIDIDAIREAETVSSAYENVLFSYGLYI
jgi:hypothetical protein